MRRLERILLPMATFAVLLMVWQLVASSGLYADYLFPSPHQVINGVLELSLGYTLWSDLGTSLFRFLSGFLTAALIAIPLGLVLGWYNRVWTALDPLVQVLRPISPIAWLPFIGLWFGIGDLPAIVIIFLAAFYPILLSTISAVHNVDPVYLKVAQNFGSSKRDILIKVVIPAAFPHITMGLHVAIGSAWVFLVAGEMMGVRSGLGYLIVDSRNYLRTDLVLVGIVFIGIMGLLIDRVVGAAERYVKKQWGIVN
ncbi:MAG TPA: ABC transporter permease [Candidatus Acidoferrales bacterium]|nr:ABC transporter permease [Candidatus Acidoferrales bacterium]